MKLNPIFLIIGILILAGLSTASDYLVDENMDMRGNDIYNATNINATNLKGDLQSEYVKSPPASCSSGYAMTQFVLNFSTVTCSQFLTVADNTTMKNYVDAQDTTFNTSMKTYVDAKNDSRKIYVDAQDAAFNSSMKTYTDAQDLSYNTTMTAYVNAQDAKQISLTGGTMTGNITRGDNIHDKYGSSDDACIYYNGSALIISTVAGDCS